LNFEVLTASLPLKNGSGFYFIEYTLQSPGEGRKHLYSAIGMLTNGWYNRLYTVTGQVLFDIPQCLCVWCFNLELNVR